MISNAQFTNDKNTIIKADFDGVTMLFPADEKNRHYRELIAEGVQIAAYQAPVESVDQWRARVEVTKRQGVIAIYSLDNGQTLQAIKSAVQSAGGLAQIDWETASTFKRLNPTVLAIQQVMGWTDEQLDDLFRAAEQVPT